MLAEVRAGLKASLRKKRKKSRPPDLINMGLSDGAGGNVRGATGDTSVKQAATLFERHRTSSTWGQWRRTEASVASAVAATDCTLTFPARAPSLLGRAYRWENGKNMQTPLTKTHSQNFFIGNWISFTERYVIQVVVAKVKPASMNMNTRNSAQFYAKMILSV